MSNRDDFLKTTKDILRDRAGNKCAFPECNAPTSGSSNESDESVDSTGMACHIYAAAPGKGAKRYDKEMSSDARRSVKNGIWMCYKHGKQIDNDECRFTSDILFKWKKISEKKSQIENELGRSISNEPKYLFSLGLATQDIKIENTNGSENIIIGEALINSCANAVWGKEIVNNIRDYLIERTRNAIKYGKANFVKLEIQVDKIILTDDGDDFTYHDLLNHPDARGGAKSKKQLLENYGHKVITVSQRINNENKAVFAIPTDLNSIEKLTPCTIELSYEMRESKSYNIEIIKACSDMYIRLPRFFSTSDMYWLKDILPHLDNNYNRLVFVIDSVANHISSELKESYLDSRIITLNE